MHVVLNFQFYYFSQSYGPLSFLTSFQLLNRLTEKLNVGELLVVGVLNILIMVSDRVIPPS